MHNRRMNTRERLVHYVQELERLEAIKDDHAGRLREGFEQAKAAGYDVTTLRVVLKLRKMTPSEREQRRALEAIYMAALGMLEGEALPEAARRRFDPPGAPAAGQSDAPAAAADEPPARTDQPATPAQPSLALKDPAEARQEGADAAAAGQRIYDNPYPAGDPCRAAWDEGWCGQQRSHGMETPAAYQRRSDKPPKKADDGDAAPAAGEAQKGAA